MTATECQAKIQNLEDTYLNIFSYTGASNNATKIRESYINQLFANSIYDIAEKMHDVTDLPRFEQFIEGAAQINEIFLEKLASDLRKPINDSISVRAFESKFKIKFLP